MFTIVRARSATAHIHPRMCQRKRTRQLQIQEPCQKRIPLYFLDCEFGCGDARTQGDDATPIQNPRSCVTFTISNHTPTTPIPKTPTRPRTPRAGRGGPGVLGHFSL